MSWSVSEPAMPRMVGCERSPFLYALSAFSMYLALVAGAFAVEADAGSADSPLFACMRSPEIAAELGRHLRFGEAVAGLRAAPGALLVPLRDGRPTGVAKQVQGRKPRDFYERYFGARGDDGQ